MSLIRLFAGFLRWSSAPLTLAEISSAVQHGIPAQAMEFVNLQTIKSSSDFSHLSRIEWKDEATVNYDSIIASQNVNQSLFNITPWHRRIIEYSDLTKIAAIQEGRLEVVSHPDLGTQPVLVKKAALPEYIESVSRETEFYRLLDGLGVTPLFLGHVAEAGFITGFIAEYVELQQQQKQQRKKEVEEERSHSRVDGTEACLSALRRMHGRGIAHRDAHSGNCLVRPDGSAVIVDFELAEEDCTGEEFERDLWVMKHSRDVEDEVIQDIIMFED